MTFKFSSGELSSSKLKALSSLSSKSALTLRSSYISGSKKVRLLPSKADSRVFSTLITVFYLSELDSKLTPSI